MSLHLVSKKHIDKFLSSNTIAIVGASRNVKSFSAEVGKHLSAEGYDIYSINPAYANEKSTEKQISSIEQLPENVKSALILCAHARTEALVQAAIDKGIQNLWIQQMSDTPRSIEMALEAGINLVHNHCIFMFSNPKGIHKFHYNIKKFFGGIPK